MENHIISIDASLIHALRMLNDLSGKVMTLFAVDNNGIMRGTVTDGDIRRALIAGASLQCPVESVMHKSFRFIRSDTDNVQSIRAYRNSGIQLLPVLNYDGSINEILDLSVERTRLPLSAIIMAGGKGERLRPLTLDIPKPLLKIGDKPIIDYNIEALLKCGIKDITISLRYLADKMIDHICQLNYTLGTDIKYVVEDQPLGTIGSASLVDLPEDGYSIVMNSDLLTTISYEDMYLHHIQQCAQITIAAIPYQVSVPFAILSIDNSEPQLINGIEEKPSFSYFANAGIYIFPNLLLSDLPKDHRTDATDLIESAIRSGLRTTYYPINGTWIDVGSHTDFKQANELIKTLNTFNI